MDSLKETDKPAPNPSKHLRIEVDEELMRQMIAGQAPLDSKVVRRIPEPKEGAEETIQEPMPKSEIDESFPSVVPTAVAAGKDASGFRRKSSRYRILNARSSHQRIAVTAQQSTSAPQPRAKCRQSSTCWETTRLGLRRWSTICYALS